MCSFFFIITISLWTVVVFFDSYYFLLFFNSKLAKKRFVVGSFLLDLFGKHFPPKFKLEGKRKENANLLLFNISTLCVFLIFLMVCSKKGSKSFFVFFGLISNHIKQHWTSFMFLNKTLSNIRALFYLSLMFGEFLWNFVDLHRFLVWPRFF